MRSIVEWECASTLSHFPKKWVEFLAYLYEILALVFDRRKLACPSYALIFQSLALLGPCGVARIKNGFKFHSSIFEEKTGFRKLLSARSSGLDGVNCPERHAGYKCELT